MDLRAIAEAATPGRRTPTIGKVGVGALAAERRSLLLVQVHPLAIFTEEYADAHHIAAWSPQRAIAALDVIEAAEVVRAAMESGGLDSASDQDEAVWQDFRNALWRWEALP